MPVVEGVGLSAGLGFAIGVTDNESQPDPFAGVGAAAGVATVLAYSSSAGIGAAAGVATATGVGSLSSTTGAGLASSVVTIVGFATIAPTQIAENPKHYFLRVREVRIGANGIAEFDLVREDISIYDALGASPILGSDLAGGSPAPPPSEEDEEQSDASRPGSTRLVLIDGPQLLAEHRDPGFYAAASGSSSGWAGAILYRKDGQDYTEIAQLPNRAIIGWADTALGSGEVTLFNASGRTFQWDDVNSVDITLIEEVSTLASVSDDDVLSGRNIAAIGQHGAWEIVGFGTVEQLDVRKFRLSHLLRGLKGTEWAVAGHRAGDRFVVLDSSLRRVTHGFDIIGVERTYRAVSIGGVFSSGFDTTFTNQGVSLKPLAPVYIHGTEDDDQNRVIYWWDRSRYDGLAGREGTELPPQDETVMRYEVDILNGAGTTVLRTITALGEAAAYTSAQQTTDHGSVPSSLTVRIYKISPTMGRGYVGEATIDFWDPASLPVEGSTAGIYDIYVYVPSIQRVSRRIFVGPLVRPVLLPAGLSGSRGKARGGAAAAQSIYSLEKNGVQFGTATFAAAGTVPTITSAADTVIDPAAGDTFEIVEPAIPDITLKDVGFGFAGVRIIQ